MNKVRNRFDSVILEEILENTIDIENKRSIIIERNIINKGMLKMDISRTLKTMIQISICAIDIMKVGIIFPRIISILFNGEASKISKVFLSFSPTIESDRIFIERNIGKSNISGMKRICIISTKKRSVML